MNYSKEIIKRYKKEAKRESWAWIWDWVKVGLGGLIGFIFFYIWLIVILSFA